jgi:hypothetical protein
MFERLREFLNFPRCEYCRCLPKARGSGRLLHSAAAVRVLPKQYSRQNATDRKSYALRILQSPQKAATPPMHVVLFDARQQLLVPLLALGQWHVQCALNGLRRAMRVIRVD